MNPSAPLDPLFARATSLHRQGRFADAIPLYRQIAQRAPRNAAAWNLLGLASFQAGDAARGVTYVEKALEIDPKVPGGHYNLGTMFQALGRLPDAAARFGEALARQPHDIQARTSLGTVLRALGRTQEAVGNFRKVLEIKPDFVEARFNLGNALQQLGQHEQAIREFQLAVASKPDLIPAYIGWGISLQALRRPQDAVEKFKQAIAHDSKSAPAHFNLANALRELDRDDDAIVHYQSAIALDPGYVEAHVNLGTAYTAARRYDDAVESFERALAIRPDAKAHFNLATALKAADRYEEALENFDCGIALAPDDANVRAHKGLLALALGRFGEGWDLYQSRFGTPDSQLRPYPQRLWDGRKVAGTLLVWGEQGLGDQILYSSMINELRAVADSLVVEVEPRLVSLFTRSFPDVVIRSQGEELYSGDIAAHASLGSVGRFLRRDWVDFSNARHPWLVPDPLRTNAMRKRLADGREIIGLSWHSKNPNIENLKSAPLTEFASLLALPDCRFIDLQYGDTSSDREAIERALGVCVEHLPDIDNTADIDALSSLIAACDLVVTVSNTTAHLAGAIGARTVVLLPHGVACPWYWFRDRSDSPWYPTLALYRQTRDESWSELLGRVIPILPLMRPSKR